MEGYPDSPEIAADAQIWRRVPLFPHLITNAEGIERPSSAAFADSSDGSPMSVAISTIVRDPWRLVEGQDIPCAVVGFTAGLARGLGLRVCLDTSGEEYEGHAYLAGPKPKSAKKSLATGSTWVISPSEARAKHPRKPDT